MVIADEANLNSQTNNTNNNNIQIPVSSLSATDFFILGLPAPTHFLEDNEGGSSSCPSNTMTNSQHSNDTYDHSEDDMISGSGGGRSPGGGNGGGTGSINGGGDDESMSVTDQSSLGMIMDQMPGVFQCNLCPVAFKYQYQLMAHKRNIHEGSKRLFTFEKNILF